ncbi:MAG: sigma-70 family RNA polymerase sigma factor [Gemmataceae bacterium]|nr:sigma-70 family RNA polymerase sigma factor [Gemmataceae bacterium]
MPVGEAHTLLRYIQTLVAPMNTAPDVALLERFVSQRDEAAFATLIRRHGPMVLRLCGRILHNQHDAEDVLQATFLVLSHKAASVRRQASIGSWLYGVAYRLALKLKSRSTRRLASEGRADWKPTADPLAEISVREVQEIVDRELACLPDKYRAPFVLCCLEGLTRDEAALQLGCSLSVLKNRLEESRKRLRTRLTARGVTLPAALLASFLSEHEVAAVAPMVLMKSTVNAAVTIASEGSAASLVSARVAALVEGAVRAMSTAKLKIVSLFILTAAAIGLGAAGVVTYGMESTTSGIDVRLRKTGEDAEFPTSTYFQEKIAKPQVTEKWQLRASLREPKAAFHNVMFSPDGKTIATAGVGGIVKLWDVARHEVRTTVPTGHRGIAAVAFSPDSSTIASTGDDGAVKLWNATTGKVRAVWRIVPDEQAKLVDKGAVAAGANLVAFSPDGKFLATAWRTTVKVWDATTGREKATLEGHSESIRTLAYALGGKVLVTGSIDKTVKLWDITMQRERASFQGLTDGHFAVSGDGKTLAIAKPQDQSVTITLWDVEMEKEKFTLKDVEKSGAIRLALSHDGKTLATDRAQVRLWDVGSGKELAAFRKGGSNPALCLAFSSNNRILAAAGYEIELPDEDFDGLLNLWELRPIEE